MRGPIVLLVVLFGALFGPAAEAHEKSISHVEVRTSTTVGGAVEAELFVSLRRIDATRLGRGWSEWAHGGPFGGEVARRARDLVRLSVEGQACRPVGARSALAPATRLAFRVELSCGAAPDTLDLESVWLLPGHLSVIRWLGPASRTAILTEAQPRLDLRAEAPPSPALWSGIEHILSGWDHLAFVVVLLLGAGSLGGIARVVSGFTLGHSLTLGLATLGWIAPSSREVEVVIAFSVLALVSSEITRGHRRRGEGSGVWPLALPAGAMLLGLLAQIPAMFGIAIVLAFEAWHEARRPPTLPTGVQIAAIFGLVHGLGFAGALSETGAPPSLGHLFLWNLGVEVGQLAVCALVWPLLVLFRRHNQEAGLRSLALGSAAAVGSWALVSALAG